MNKIELDRLEWCYEQIHRYKEAALRLEGELRDAKAQLAKNALNEKFGSPDGKVGDVKCDT